MPKAKTWCLGGFWFKESTTEKEMSVYKEENFTDMFIGYYSLPTMSKVGLYGFTKEQLKEAARQTGTNIWFTECEHDPSLYGVWSEERNLTAFWEIACALRERDWNE